MTRSPLRSRAGGILLHRGQEMALRQAFVLLLLMGSLFALGPSVQAAAVRSTAAEAELVSAQATIVPGRSLALGLRLKLDPGWHVYWKNAGDSGNPPILQVQLPPGFNA